MSDEQGSVAAAHPTALELAQGYRARGWKPIRIGPGLKAPRTKGWQQVEFPDEMFVGVQWNVGVQLGAVSGGLLDIDFDWQTAARIGDLVFGFAPAFGRASNPASHRLVRVTDGGKVPTKKYAVPGRTKEKGCMVLELRGCGCQTVFPGSVHPSGERIEWTAGRPPDAIPEVTFAELQRLADATVVLTIAAAFWPVQGNRDTFSMAVAGVLLRMQFTPELVDEWVVAAAGLAGDEEAEKRRKAVQTKAKLDAGDETTGLPTMLELLATDEDGVRTLLRKAAGFKATPASAASQSSDEGEEVGADTVELRPGFLDQALNAMQAVLLRKQAPLYQRGGQLVIPIRLDQDFADDADVRRRAGSLYLHRPTASGLVSFLAGRCRFVRKVRNKLVRVDPTTELANVFAAGRERWRLPALDAVTGTPVFRTDGTILTTPGYDPVTRLYFDPAGMVFPEVKDAPTREDALAALALLKRPFREFPIPRPECRSALWAALLTPFVLPTVPAVPGFGVSSPAPGFGKTKLAECISVLATGVAAAAMNQGANEEEDEKRIGAALLAGDVVLMVDNIVRPVGGPTWCSVITNSMHRPRVLGRSELPAVSSRVLPLFNGVNLAFVGDITRRVLLVVVEDGNVEHPEKRSFDFDPVEEVKAARADMVAAALTVLRAYHCAGRPVPAGFTPMGSFTDWDVVRLALLWLGEVDPARSQELVVEDDPQREADADLLALLWRAREGRAFKAADLRNDVEQGGKPTPLGDALLEGVPWNARRVGHRLRLLADRWVVGARLRTVKVDGVHGHAYRVEWRDSAPGAPF